MNKYISLLPFTAATLTVAMIAAPVFAAKNAEPETLTCEEFLAIDKNAQLGVVYWLKGKSGEVDTIDIEEYDAPLVYVVTECEKDKKATVSQKEKHHRESLK